MPNRTIGKSRSLMYEEELEQRMAERLTVRCSLCNGRRFQRTGPAAVVIRAIAEHRAQAHPGVVDVPRNRTFRARAIAAQSRAAAARERRKVLGREAGLGEGQPLRPNEVAA